MKKRPETVPVWREDVDLGPFNTLAIPAIAERFTEVATVEQLVEAFVQSRQLGCDHPLVIGGGSNLVLTRARYPLVIHLQLKGTTIHGDGRVTVAAGECWHEFVLQTLERGLYGLENLALIPGSCGAAPIQNIGAYGVEVGDFISAVSAVHRQSGEVHEFSAEDCHFGYRDSFFKSEVGREWVVVALTLQLQIRPRLNLSYPELARAWQEQSSWLSESELRITNDAQRLAHLVAAIRRHKLPDPATTPNAGSFFKNPIVDAAAFAELEARWPGIVGYALADGRFKLAAGWMIDQAGHKGRMTEGIGQHERQALVLVNPGRGHGQAILAFARTIQDDIAIRFGVNLEIEPDLY